jgi:protein involved in polysaccharide export with SLBB domain
VHAAFAQEAYRLQPGDSVELWVAQDPQLNRRVSIGPDGRLSLPLVGQIVARDLTIDELSNAFKERLQAYYSENLDITVMLQPSEIHARSVFVAGDVGNPGVYPYRPDMTVMHVISVAGGLYRAPFAAADQDRSTMLRGDIARTQNRVNQLGATLARLQAELSNSPSIDRTREELAGIAPEALQAILAQEQAVLDMRVAELRIRQKSEEQLKAIAVRSLEAARDQLRSVETRIDLARQRLDNTNKLITQGFAQGAQRLEMESTIASMEGERSQYMAVVATQEAAVVNYDAGMEAFLQTRKTELLSSLNNTRREREALVSTLNDSIRALKAYDEASAGAQNTVITYSILRTRDGKTEEIPASELTTVEPGDLVRVARLLAVGSASVAGD